METKRTKILFLIGCLLFTLIKSDIFCQPVNVSGYSFLNMSADTVEYYGYSREQFKLFVKKFSQMIRLGNNQINILHIGDSHLQADLYTGQVRKNFQSFTDGLTGARGMITPFLKGCPDSYKVTFSPSWASENIISSKDKENLGLWGTTVYTRTNGSTVNISVNNKNSVKYDFNRLRIYHSPLGQGDNIILSDLETAYQKVYNSKYGYTEFVLADYITDVTVTVKKTSSDTFYIYGFYFTTDDPGVVYNVTGTNGASAMSYLGADKLFSHIESIKPDMVILSLGTNDTYEPGGENTFENNLSALVNKIKSATNNVPVLLITPLECYYHRKRINPRQDKTIEIIKNTAKNTGCLYLDMYKVFGGKGSSDKLLHNSLMQTDRIHLTSKGYQMEGDLLYNALWDAIEKNF
ncbi:MAG: hypothetical protein IJ681_06500 [Bacteroidales bacterium]|nr:hypothetical protein [Bacteroidales bacterium]